MKVQRKAALILSWGFVAVCMIIIFCFSNEVATDSSETSAGIIQKVLDWFGLEISQHLVRKTAHALEYFGLQLAFYIAYSVTYRSVCPWLSLLSTVLYATSDEIHQFFIEGRACQLRDVFIDTCGAVISLVILTTFYCICKKHKQKSEDKLCQ